VKTLDQFDIRGRSAIVTGAASGIGLACAETMAEAGATVTLTDIDVAGLERERRRLEGLGYRVRSAELDASDLDATQRVFGEHVSACGGLDIAFANAGVDSGAGFWNPAGHRNPDGQIDTLDPVRWRRSMDINLNGIFYTIREAARLMKPARKGSIIATSSNAALINEAIVGTAYMPAKAGVAHLVRQVALELAEFGIRVNAIAPGPFVTNIGGGWLRNPAVRAAWDKQVPLGRIAETWQIKPLALYLASDASSYMTGSHVVIDGGTMLGHFR
jgi:NAD(P)-dependent dehydrogenase (short-subunit alcohol dehydrogenase family)